MSKPTTIIAAFLALLTGLVLGQLGSLAVPRIQSATLVSAVPAQELETVRSFYDGMNRFLATGDPGVESMLTVDFVDRTSSLPSGRNAEQLMADWSAIGAFLPHIQFEVVDLQGWGTLIAAQLEIRPGSASVISGIAVHAPSASSVIEFLRIRNGKVAERWSDDRLPGMALTVHADFVRTGPALSGPVIQRITLPAGQEVALLGNDTVVLRVVSGELRLNQLAVDPLHDMLSTSDPVKDGEIRIVDVADTLVFRNLSRTATEFLAFSLYGLYSVETPLSTSATAVATAGVDTTTLTYMPLLLNATLDRRLRLSVTELTLPAGSWVAPHTPGGVEEIVVLDGTLEASVQSGRALISAGNSQSHPFDGVETATAGQGFSANSLATLSYRVTSAQPVNLLIMTLEPAPLSEDFGGV